MKSKKKEKLTIQKLQEQRNRVDLAYNKNLSEWDKTRPKTGEDIDNQMYSIVDDQVKAAADAQMALLNETDLTKKKRIFNSNKEYRCFARSTRYFYR